MRQVSATELAKLGKCERQLYWDYHFGEDLSLSEQSIKRGNDEHEEFNRRLSGQKKGSWIVVVIRIIWRWIVKLWRG